MPDPGRGEVWLVDLGLVAKVRPCLILSIPVQDTDRALVTLIPHTTRVRKTRFEVGSSAKFLHAGAFDAQNLVTIPLAKVIRRLGKLRPTDLQTVEEAVRTWLGL